MNDKQKPMMPPVTSAVAGPEIAAQPVAAHRKSRLSTKLLLSTAALIGLAVLVLAVLAINLGTAAITNPADAEVSIATLRNQILLGALAIFLIGGAGAAVLAHTFCRPIIRLKEVADQVALGKVEVDLEIAAHDELADLMGTFETMIQNNKDLAETAKRMAQGDFGVDIIPRSADDVLASSLIAVR